MTIFYSPKRIYLALDKIFGRAGSAGKIRGRRPVLKWK
jgi:hypothetical protein